MVLSRWFVVLSLTLSFLLIALTWIVRPGHCLGSKIFDRMVFASSEKQETLWACSVRPGALFSQDLEDLRVALQPRLQRLEEQLDLIDVSVKPLELKIVDSLYPVQRVDESSILMSRDLLARPGLLEKNILLALLFEKSKENPEMITHARGFGSFALSSEILVELTQLTLAGGSASFTDASLLRSEPLNSVAIEAGRLLMPAADLCKSRELPAYLTRRCQLGFLEDTDAYVSLAPLFTKVIWMNWKQRGLGANLEALRKFWSQALVTKPKSLVSLEEDFFTEISLPAPLRGLEVWARTSPFVKEFDFRSVIATTPRLDTVLIVDPSEISEFFAKNEILFKKGQGSLMIVSGDQSWWAPSKVSRPLSWSSHWKARQKVLVQCRLPSIQQIRDLSVGADKLMLVRQCADSGGVNWRSLARFGIEEFIRLNPQLDFIQFHVPSLESAWARQMLNPIPFVAEGDFRSPFFKDIGWQNPVWDSELKAYRTRAAIEAIEIFRSQPVSRM